MHATIPIIPPFLLFDLLINFTKMSLLSGPLWLGALIYPLKRENKSLELQQGWLLSNNWEETDDGQTA